MSKLSGTGPPKRSSAYGGVRPPGAHKRVAPTAHSSHDVKSVHTGRTFVIAPFILRRRQRPAEPLSLYLRVQIASQKELCLQGRPAPGRPQKSGKQHLGEREGEGEGQGTGDRGQGIGGREQRTGYRGQRVNTTR